MSHYCAVRSERTRGRARRSRLTQPIWNRGHVATKGNRGGKMSHFHGHDPAHLESVPCPVGVVSTPSIERSSPPVQTRQKAGSGECGHRSSGPSRTSTSTGAGGPPRTPEAGREGGTALTPDQTTVPNGVHRGADSDPASPSPRSRTAYSPRLDEPRLRATDAFDSTTPLGARRCPTTANRHAPECGRRGEHIGVNPAEPWPAPVSTSLRSSPAVAPAPGATRGARDVPSRSRRRSPCPARPPRCPCDRSSPRAGRSPEARSSR